MSLLYRTQKQETESSFLKNNKRREALLLLKNIKKSYSSGFCLEIDELMFSRGQVHVIMGPNGSGKTVLLNIAGFMENPDEGRVALDDHAGLIGSGGILGARRRIGFIMQESFLFNRSVYYNVVYGLKTRKICRREIDRRVGKALREMGIEHLKNRNTRELSGGEKKRVSIAQVLALDTDIILMDEPMAHVDRATSAAVEKLIKGFKKEKTKTVVITTHSVDQAYRLSEDIISLKAGRISDYIHENTFYGVVENCGDGIGRMAVAEDIDIYLVTEELGQIHIAIDPESILLSKERLVSSARNLFYGAITRVEDIGANVRVFVDCGVEFCSIITKRSYAQMDLNVGSFVYLSFKINSVKVI